MIKLKSAIVLFAFVICSVAYGQAPKRMNSSEIYSAIEKLNFLGSVLFVAAHPDDENTFVISYLANEQKARTAYLSLTRGDGGQNLIGPEIESLLGVIRTQELLAARRLDGGEQLFTRANDFGFSKNSEETIAKWNKDQVLSDVVWAIRTYQPDIVINRFHHESSGQTHGHHSASAELSYEAFDLAGDPNAYKEQLSFVAPYQPNRLFFNTSYWFYGRDRAKFDAMDKSHLYTVDVGVYYPEKGMSNNELAAYSRSQHVCQGMGRTPQRGKDIEYFEFLKGEEPHDKSNIFTGINTTWSRVEGGSPITGKIDQLLSSYDFQQPENSLAQMMSIYQMIKSLPDGVWKTTKLKEAEDIILHMAGLHIEANPDAQTAVPGDDVGVRVEAINRSANDGIILTSISLQGLGEDSTLSITLKPNIPAFLDFKCTIPTDAKTTDPYWLQEPGIDGMYIVKDQRLIGLPETPRDLLLTVELMIEEVPLTITRPLIYKETDRERGEIYSPFEITDPVHVAIKEQVYVFAKETPQTIGIVVTAATDNVKGQVTLPTKSGWKITPASLDFDIKKKGEEQFLYFEVTPPAQASESVVEPRVKLDSGNSYNRSLIKIAYDHIPQQLVTKKASANLVKLDIKIAGNRIGYIDGAGDGIPSALTQMGYQVDYLSLDQITKENLVNYDAVVLGIRAYNKEEALQFKQSVLYDYVSNGGTLLSQYMVTWGLHAESIAPLPLKLSRDRVTVEDAPVQILAAEHPMLNHPNKITLKDFEGWVQERGLYFANEWDVSFVPLWSSADPGEEPLKGGMLVAPYGKGYFIYSGYSWFRQLPAGVPGAYRIFANLVSQTPKTRL